MERSPNPHTPEVAHNFLVDAIKDGAIDRYKDKFKNDTSVRNLNILGLYRGTFLNQTDIAQETQLTRERVRQVIKSTTSRIWNQCSPEIKRKYDRFEVLVCGEKTIPPLFTTTNKLENSHEPIIPLDSETRAKYGKTTVQKIRIAKRKAELIKKKENKNTLNGVWNTINKIINESADNDQVQNAFEILDFKHAKDLVQGEDSSLINFTDLFGTSPIRHSDEIFRTLRRHNLPVLRIQHNFHKNYPHLILCSYYVPKRLSESAITCIQNSDVATAIKPKVTQISGPKTAVPTTHQLQKSGEFEGVFTHGESKRLQGYMLNNPQISLDEIIKDCPHPVFKLGRGYRCRIKDKRKIKIFLEQRARQLGLPTKTAKVAQRQTLQT